LSADPSKYSVERTNQPDGDWIIKDGTFYVDSVKVSPISYAGYPIKKEVPIAVLISGNTASSGEMMGHYYHWQTNIDTNW
jgi:hypothetical protein